MSKKAPKKAKKAAAPSKVGDWLAVMHIEHVVGSDLTAKKVQDKQSIIVQAKDVETMRAAAAKQLKAERGELKSLNLKVHGRPLSEKESDAYKATQTIPVF
jgi:hypothetical protein